MNYLKIYNNIIDKRKNNAPNGYIERHHIVPKCLGGSDDDSNIIKLTAREHYIAHYLLTKIYKKETIEWYKMVNAFLYMNCNSLNHNRYFNSKLYASLKEKFSDLMRFLNTGNKNSQFGKIWIYNEKLNISKAVNNNELLDYLNNDWKLGRIINWESYKKNKQKKLLKIIERNKKDIEKIKIYTYYYQLYDKYGWEKFKEITKYKFTKQNLIMRFVKFVKDFKPQNGKKRGKI